MPERSKFHGRKPHTPGRAHKQGSICMVGGVMYKHKRDAARASPKKRAKQCGRCNQWHPVE